MLLLFYVAATRNFSLDTLVFSSPKKPTFELSRFKIHLIYSLPNNVEYLCLAGKIWDLNKVIIILERSICYYWPTVARVLISLTNETCNAQGISWNPALLRLILTLIFFNFSLWPVSFRQYIAKFLMGKAVYKMAEMSS